MVGIINTTVTNFSQIESFMNITSPAQFFVNVNEVIYGGWLFFILFLVTWVILFVTANMKNDQTLNNAMYASAAVTVLTFLARAVIVTTSAGVVKGLLTDWQLWIFPVITILLALVIWMTRDT